MDISKINRCIMCGWYFTIAEWDAVYGCPNPKCETADTLDIMPLATHVENRRDIQAEGNGWKWQDSVDI